MAMEVKALCLTGKHVQATAAVCVTCKVKTVASQLFKLALCKLYTIAGTASRVKEGAALLQTTHTYFSYC